MTATAIALIKVVVTITMLLKKCTKNNDCSGSSYNSDKSDENSKVMWMKVRIIKILTQ